MNRSFKIASIDRFFAIREDRIIVRKSKTNHKAKLHARAAHAFYWLCASLRGLLAAAGSGCTGSTAWQAGPFTQPAGAWVTGMQNRMTVRRQMPAVVVA